MDGFVELLTAAGLFGLGMAMSFFFSGSETAFYRVSTVRLTIDATAGDRVAKRLLWFAHRPGRFVATTLVGNNVAHDLVSVGAGIAASLLIRSEGLAEVAGSWAVTPLLFVCGDLLPKNLCYLAPSWLLRRGSLPFMACYYAFLPISLPLGLISQLLQRIAGGKVAPMGAVFGRSHLTQVLSEGRQHGLLGEAQVRFLTGLLSASGDTVVKSMTPADRVYGLTEAADREAVLEHARRYAVADVVMGGRPGEWTHYVRAAEVALSDRPLATHIRPLPRFDAKQARLEVLLALRTAGETVGAVVQEGRVVGVVNERGLVESLFRAGRVPVVAA